MPSSAGSVTRCSPERRRRWLTSSRVTMICSSPLSKIEEAAYSVKFVLSDVSEDEVMLDV